MTTESQIAADRRSAGIFGIYSASDFVRPDEVHTYETFCHHFNKDLRPHGPLEHTLAAEIIHAAWRLRRCATAESEMQFAPEDPLLTQTQAAIDRARAQAQRQLLSAANELRRLQTERQIRVECLPESFDTHTIGGLASIKSIQAATRASVVRDKTNELKRFLQKIENRATVPSPESSSTKRTQSEAPESQPTPRNAPCPCGSGDKYKRCCGRSAPPVLQQAA